MMKLSSAIRGRKGLFGAAGVLALLAASGLAAELPITRQAVAKHLAALGDRKSTRLNSSHAGLSRMPSSA